MELLKSKSKAAGTGKKGGQSSNGKSKRKKEKSNSRPYAKEIANCQAMQSMCGGYYKVAFDFTSSFLERIPKDSQILSSSKRISGMSPKMPSLVFKTSSRDTKPRFESVRNEYFVDARCNHSSIEY